MESQHECVFLNLQNMQPHKKSIGSMDIFKDTENTDTKHDLTYELLINNCNLGVTHHP